MKTTAKIPDERAIAVNGKAYNLFYASKTAKKVDHLLMDGFIENDTPDPMTADVEKNNTKILFNFLKEKFPDAVMKYGKIQIADYKICYSSHGFQINDMRNYGEQINMNNFHNDFPTPETVMKFITDTIKRPFAKRKQLQRDEVKIGEIMKLASLGKVTIKNIKTLEVEEIKPAKMKDRLHLETENIFRRYKDGVINYTVAQQKLKNRVPEKIVKQCTDLLKRFRKGDVAWRKVILLLEKDIMLPYLEFKKNEKVKPVRVKFEPPVLWEPINPVIAVCDAWMTQSGGESIGTSDYHDSYEEANPVEESTGLFAGKIIEPDIMWMRFETRGPSGKKYTVECTVEEYLANVVLHHFPKAMPMLMKIANGEITELPDLLNMSFNRFIVDPYQPYDPKVLRHPVNRYLFCRVCIDIILIEELDVMFRWRYNNDVQSGEQLIVISNDNATYNRAVVINNESGILLRYEYGTVERLRANEVVRFEKWK